MQVVRKTLSGRENNMSADKEFFSAVSKRNIIAIEQAILVNKFNIDTQIEGSKSTALHMAVSDCNFELVQWLVLNKANCNIGNKYGFSPLKSATLCLDFESNKEESKEYINIIMFLLKKSIEDKIDNSSDKISAIRVLARKKDFTENEISLFVAILDDKDWKVRVAAVEAVGNQNFLSPQDMAFFDKAMHDSEGIVRNTVVQILGKHNPFLPETLDLLRLALIDPEPSIRIAVIKIFGHQLKGLGNPLPVSRGMLNALIEVMDDKDPGMRITAIEAVTNQNLPSAEALAFYYKAIHDRESSVRHAAVKALGEQDPLSAEIIAILRQAVTDHEPSIRTAVNIILNKQKENTPEKTLFGNIGNMANIGWWFNRSEKEEEETPLLQKGIKPKQE